MGLVTDTIIIAGNFGKVYNFYRFGGLEENSQTLIPRLHNILIACIVFPNSLRGACALKTSADFKASRK